jgi:hypothetical protein
VRITIIVLLLIATACGEDSSLGAGSGSALSPREFCKELTTTLCMDASQCGQTVTGDCAAMYAAELGCSGWTEANVCEAGHTFNEEIASDCLIALEALKCWRVDAIFHDHEEEFPVSCQSTCD